VEEQLPLSYQLFLDDDATEYLAVELDKIVLRSGLSLGILLLFVLLVYRSWRHLLVIVCSLLANLGVAFIFYYLWQVEMHLYALAGITVSFGIIIDNAIVMVHHLRSQGNLKECMEEMEKEMPLGYLIEEQRHSFNNENKQNWLLLLVIGFIFFICAIIFESLRQAFAVILLIPTSFIGIFLTFYWFDFNFDQGGYASFILLSGIVVNSIIFIINDYNQFRKRFTNRSSLKNYIKAFQHKISPILLTIISTILGLVPFLLHGSREVFWFSLAVSTIGGLLFSLIVIFLFIPIFIVEK